MTHMMSTQSGAARSATGSARISSIVIVLYGSSSVRCGALPLPAKLTHDHAGSARMQP
jgi:hypothetical protein